MLSRESIPGWPILVIACVVIVMASLKAAATIFVPFLLAVFLATLTIPIVLWLHRYRVPKLIAVLMVVGAVVGFLTLIGVVAANSLQAFNQNLPEYQRQLTAQLDALTDWIQDVSIRLGIQLSATDLLGQFDLRALAGVAGSTLLQVGNILTKVFLAVVLVIFMLLESFHFDTKMANTLGATEKTWAGFKEFADVVQKYLAIKTATSLATGVAAGLWVWILGVDYPVFWGLLAFVFNYVPNIGSFIAATPAVLMALVQFGLGPAVAVGLGYVVINILVGAVIEPKFMGAGVGLSPVVVLLSLVFWGWLLGGVGMFLSTPLTMSVKIALDNYDSTRWISAVIGSHKS